MDNRSSIDDRWPRRDSMERLSAHNTAGRRNLMNSTLAREMMRGNFEPSIQMLSRNNGIVRGSQSILDTMNGRVKAHLPARAASQLEIRRTIEDKLGSTSIFERNNGSPVARS